MIKLPYNFTHRDYQVEPWNAIMEPDFQRGCLVVPRRNGKDLLCWNAIIAKAMQRTGLYYYIAPFYNQVRQIIWEGFSGDGRRFLDYIPRDLIVNKTKVDMRIDLEGGSQIKLLGSDMIDRIVGTNPIGIVFTEFSLHKVEVWDYLRPILAENGGWALFNGTPRGMNHFFHLFERAKKDPGWYTQYLTRDDTGVPTLEAIEADRRSGMSESKIDQEYYCSWVASSEETLIPLDIIEPCYDLTLFEPEYNFEPKIMGVDVAYAAKGDKAVIAKRQGRLLHPLISFQGMNNMALATRVIQEFKEWNADAIFIDAGRGEGVISRLDQLGFGEYTLPVHFSGKPFSDLYLNKRAEIWGRVKDWFLKENKPSVPEDTDLISDLSAPKVWVNDKGFVQMESKLQMRARGIKSTDHGDAVAITFAEEFVDKREKSLFEKVMDDMHSFQRARGYDPLTHITNLDGYNGLPV